MASKSHPYEVGKAYLIRTVTHYYTCKIVKVFPQELLVSDAAWIADTGRFSTALETGVLSEIEPIKGRKIVIGRSAIVDAIPWSKALPKEQK